MKNLVNELKPLKNGCNLFNNSNKMLSPTKNSVVFASFCCCFLLLSVVENC